MQVVRDHQLGLQCIWDDASPVQNSSNGASSPEQEPFTTWKFRSEGVSKRTIDYIWWALEHHIFQQLAGSVPHATSFRSLGAALGAKGKLLLWASRHSRPSLWTGMARSYIPFCQGGLLSLQAHIVFETGTVQAAVAESGYR